jgi:hypothetical protein
MSRERTVSWSPESERLVATDVFLHNLEPFTLETLRRAVEQGLTPSGLDFAGDDDSIVILRFTRPLTGEAQLRPHAESEMISAGAGILEEPTHLLDQTKREAHETRRLPLAVSSFLSLYRLLRTFPESLSREEALREIGSGLEAQFQLCLAEIVDQSLD